MTWSWTNTTIEDGGTERWQRGCGKLLVAGARARAWATNELAGGEGRKRLADNGARWDAEESTAMRRWWWRRKWEDGRMDKVEIGNEK